MSLRMLLLFRRRVHKPAVGSTYTSRALDIKRHNRWDHPAGIKYRPSDYLPGQTIAVGSSAKCSCPINTKIAGPAAGQTCDNCDRIQQKMGEGSSLLFRF